MDKDELQSYESGYSTGYSGTSIKPDRDFLESKACYAKKLEGYERGKRDLHRDQKAEISREARREAGEDGDSASDSDTSDLGARTLFFGLLMCGGALMVWLGLAGLFKFTTFSLMWFISLLAIPIGLLIVWPVILGAGWILGIVLVFFVVIKILSVIFVYFSKNLY